MKALSALVGVRLKPGASREKIVSVDDREVCIAVMVPPIDGKANKALIKFLAKAVDVPKSTIAIIRGETSRIKMVEIAGMTKEYVLEKLKEMM